MIRMNTFMACAETLEEQGGTICIADDELKVGGEVVTHVTIEDTWDGDRAIRLCKGDPNDEDSDWEYLDATDDELNAVMDYVATYY